MAHRGTSGCALRPPARPAAQFRLRRGVDRSQRGKGPDQLHEGGGLEAIHRGEMADTPPGKRPCLIGVERELQLDRSNGHAEILPNRCSTCQISTIVRTLAPMPLYEYRCNDCSAVFELLRPMADREVAAVCPSCESRASMPLISRVAVHAGSGSDDVALR